jgi:hypothetical protein
MNEKGRAYARRGISTPWRFFFVLQGEKEPPKEEKYHAAAG